MSQAGWSSYLLRYILLTIVVLVFENYLATMENIIPSPVLLGQGLIASIHGHFDHAQHLGRIGPDVSVVCLSWFQQHMHQHKQPAPATISTSNTSSTSRRSIKQQQDQNRNTQNTNMIPKMQQKPSARPKNNQNLVYSSWVNPVFVTLPSEHGHSLRLSTRRYDLTRGLV